VHKGEQEDEQEDEELDEHLVEELDDEHLLQEEEDDDEHCLHEDEDDEDEHWLHEDDPEQLDLSVKVWQPIEQLHELDDKEEDVVESELDETTILPIRCLANFFHSKYITYDRIVVIKSNSFLFSI